jgi:hypothetical protein
MGLFDDLKNAIFHRHATAPAATTSATAPTASARPASTSPAASPPHPAAAPAVTPPVTAPVPPAAPIDIEANLEALNAKSPQKLNWRSSIVDLMKLVGMDSSLDHRQRLATELGYTGDPQDSAAMNIWLHKTVMRKLAESGGKIPASLQ